MKLTLFVTLAVALGAAALQDLYEPDFDLDPRNINLNKVLHNVKGSNLVGWAEKSGKRTLSAKECST